MDWLNLHTSMLDSPEVVGAEPIDRATWLFLLRYCVGQENSGIIDNCGDWGDRKWQQLCRVTLAEVQRKCALWKWMDGSLIVSLYPIDKQKEHQALCIQARAAALSRWKKARGITGGNASGIGNVPNESNMRDGMRDALPDAMHKRIEDKIKEESISLSLNAASSALVGDEAQSQGVDREKARADAQADQDAISQTRCILEAIEKNPSLLATAEAATVKLVEDLRAKANAGRSNGLRITRIMKLIPELKQTLTAVSA